MYADLANIPTFVKTQGCDFVSGVMTSCYLHAKRKRSAGHGHHADEALQCAHAGIRQQDGLGRRRNLYDLQRDDVLNLGTVRSHAGTTGSASHHSGTDGACAGRAGEVAKLVLP
jgi:hypothetical protein